MVQILELKQCHDYNHVFLFYLEKLQSLYMDSVMVYKSKYMYLQYIVTFIIVSHILHLQYMDNMYEYNFENTAIL